MCKNLNLFIILILLVNEVVYGQDFIPGPRFAHATALVEDKIYYIGGYEYESLYSSKFLYLEFKKQWVDLTSQVVNFPPDKFFHTADIGGVNLDLIFIIGGRSEEQNKVHQFDTKTNT